MEIFLKAFSKQDCQFTYSLTLTDQLMWPPQSKKSNREKSFESMKRIAKEVIQIKTSISSIRQNSKNNDLKKKNCKMYFQGCDICD